VPRYHCMGDPVGQGRGSLGTERSSLTEAVSLTQVAVRQTRLQQEKSLGWI
jgi:hypothetical protein